MRERERERERERVSTKTPIIYVLKTKHVYSNVCVHNSTFSHGYRKAVLETFFDT
jgi:hypothetical protein